MASTDRPITFTLRLSHSGFSAATRPSSVVQTGREVLRVREEHAPAVAEVLVEVELALGGVCGEVRGFVAQLDRHVVPPSSSLTGSGECRGDVPRPYAAAVPSIGTTGAKSRVARSGIGRRSAQRLRRLADRPQPAAHVAATSACSGSASWSRRPGPRSRSSRCTCRSSRSRAPRPPSGWWASPSSCRWRSPRSSAVR